MSFTQLLQCNKKLGFRRKAEWPVSWPGFVWQGVLLTPHVQAGAALHELRSDQSLENILKDIYPSLTFTELAQLVHACREAGLFVQEAALFQMYNWRWTEDVSALVELLRVAPKSFQSWAIDKEVSIRDLAPLRALKLEVDQLSVFGLFEQLMVFQPSHSEGVKWIEWVVDLTLMGQDLAQFLVSAKTAKAVTETLIGLRYPQATQNQQEAQKFVKKMPWPKNVVARQARVGDQAGIEVKFFVQSQEDMQKMAQGLSDVAKSWVGHG